MFKVLNISFSSDILLNSENGWGLFWVSFCANFAICYKGLVKVHVSEDFNQCRRKILVKSQNKYEYNKFYKDFMLFYYKNLNKIAISKEIIANLGNCKSIFFQN